MNDVSARSVLDAVAVELALWADECHPVVGIEADREKAERAAQGWRSMNRARRELGTLTWDGILSGKLFEAIAEVDPVVRRQKLIELAAAALAAAI